MQNVYMADQILLKYGVSSKQYNQALLDHDLLDTPEVKDELARSKMPPDLM